MAPAPAALDQQKQRLRFVWSAMLSSVAVYGVVCLIAVGMSDARGEAGTEWLRSAFSVAGVGLGALSIWWRRHFLFADAGPLEEPPPLAFTQFQSHGVIAWALSEAVGICGLGLAVMLRDAREFVPFGAAAAALLLLHRPSNLPWERLSSAAL